jgi:hypothetical protein
VLTAVSQIHFLVPSSAVSVCNSLFWIIIIYFFLWVVVNALSRFIFLILYIVEDNKNGEFNTSNRVKSPFGIFPLWVLIRRKKGIDVYQRGSTERCFDFGGLGAKEMDKAGKMPVLQRPREKS